MKETFMILARNLGATPLVRGKYVRVTHVRAFLSRGTFVRGNICPGEHLSGGTFVRGTFVRVCKLWAGEVLGDPPNGKELLRSG